MMDSMTIAEIRHDGNTADPFYAAEKDYYDETAPIDVYKRQMEYWTGNTYVPVTKEAIVFLLTDDGWKFSFVEDDSLAQPSGTIRVL